MFPTHHEQWVLSLKPAVQIGANKKFDYLGEEDLQRICRGHRLSSLFKDFAGYCLGIAEFHERRETRI